MKYPTPDLKINLQKDYHNLKNGLEVEFKGNFIVVVGDNGAGKTSLLTVLKSAWKGHYQGRLNIGFRETIDDYALFEGLDKFGTKKDYATSSDSVQGKSFADMDYLLKNDGIGLMRASSGQAQLGQLNKLIHTIAKDPDMSPENPTLLVLDEPEISMSLSARMTYALTLKMLALKYPIKIITATHDESIINAALSVYDISPGLTTGSGEAYIQNMRDEVTRVYGHLM